MNLSDANKGVHTHRRPKRLGRGIGSGQGKTAGRGHKGQWSHNGVSFLSIFQGGTMPLVRRIPKRGFNNRFAPKVAVINVGDLDSLSAGGEVTPETLAAASLIKGTFDEIKVLGNGELKKKLKVSAHKFSKSAAEKIAKAGGQTIIIPGPKPVVKNKMRKKEAKS